MRRFIVPLIRARLVSMPPTETTMPPTCVRLSDKMILCYGRWLSSVFDVHIHCVQRKTTTILLLIWEQLFSPNESKLGRCGHHRFYRWATPQHSITGTTNVINTFDGVVFCSLAVMPMKKQSARGQIVFRNFQHSVEWPSISWWAMWQPRVVRCLPLAKDDEEWPRTIHAGQTIVWVWARPAASRQRRGSQTTANITSKYNTDAWRHRQPGQRIYKKVRRLKTENSTE